MRTGDGLCRVELVQLRRKAAAEDIRPRQRKKPDAGTLAGHGAEQTRGSQVARAAFPRTFLHALARQGAIESNIKRSLFLADKTAFNYYKDLAEKGYYNRVISGNVTQTVEIDSVKCDFDQYPYKVNTYARQLIVRESSLTVRSLVTSCRLLNATRSDNNPHGFIIEAFTITENKDLQTIKR